MAGQTVAPARPDRTCETDLIKPCRHQRSSPGAIRKFVSRFLRCWRCCTFCCPPCPGTIIKKLAFFPPRDPSYHFVATNGKLKIEAEFEPYLYGISAEQLNRFDAFFAYTSRKNRIACFYYHCSDANPEFVILYSHANAQDIGTLLGPAINEAEILKCDFCTYDYSGYGESSGSPSEQSIHADITAVYQEVMQRYRHPPDRIILHGQSIGTFPTTYLASTQPVAAVILQAGLTSALRIINPEIKETHCIDQFASIDRMHKINAPILIIHGTRDNVIDCSHSIQLYSKAKNPVKPLWVNGGTHNDLEQFDEYWIRLLQFIHCDLLGAERSLWPAFIAYELGVAGKELASELGGAMLSNPSNPSSMSSPSKEALGPKETSTASQLQRVRSGPLSVTGTVTSSERNKPATRLNG